MPKTGKKNRVLSDILNGTKRFVAIKDCEVKYRGVASRKIEKQDFIQLNLNSFEKLKINPIFQMGVLIIEFLF